jgi:membrane-associated phospholipid phosphatase
MRRRLLLAAGLCTVAAAAVWFAAFHVPAVRSADFQLLDHLFGLGGAHVARLAADLTSFCDPGPFAVLCAALLAAALAIRRRREALVAVVLLAGSGITTQLLKTALAEQRPSPAGHYLPAASWPSGHTTAAVSLALAVVIVAPPAWRRLAALGGVLFIAATALGLLVLGSHYPTDIAGAVCVAGGWACLAATALPRRSAARARLPQRLGAPRGDVEAA